MNAWSDVPKLFSNRKELPSRFSPPFDGAAPFPSTSGSALNLEREGGNGETEVGSSQGEAQKRFNLAEGK